MAENTIESTFDTSDSNSYDEMTYNEVLEVKNRIDRELIKKSRLSLNLSKVLERKYKRDVKHAKKNRRSKTDRKNKEPSGFNKPSKVPVEFYEKPWNCEEGEELPRTVLTKKVYDYIKEHDLKNQDDKRIINTDRTIRKLFHLTKDEVLQFKNFQTYMARLYNRDNLPEWVEEQVVTKKKGKKKKKGKAKTSSV